MTYYRRRLARVHARDYTMYARAAADLLMQTVPSGSVIDVGCGAGDVVAVLGDDWDYLGIDASPDMIALAQARWPARRFLCGEGLDLPAGPVDAVLAIGEVLNYATDLAGLLTWARSCRAALRDSGVLLLDLAGPLRADPVPLTRVMRGADYRLTVTTRTDPGRRLLTRTIVLDDAQGSETEVHTLHLMDPLAVLAVLRGAGFEVTALPGYAPDLPFPRGWSGFLCRVILDS